MAELKDITINLEATIEFKGSERAKAVLLTALERLERETQKEPMCPDMVLSLTQEIEALFPLIHSRL